MIHLPLLAAALLLFACAPSTPVESPAEQAVERWEGRPIEAVIASWGEPTDRLVDDGRRLFVWEATHYDRSYYPANLDNEPRFPFLGGRSEIACKAVFEVDERGTVRSAEWQGYECHSMP